MKPSTVSNHAVLVKPNKSLFRTIVPTISGIVTGLILYYGILMFNKMVLNINQVSPLILPTIIVVPIVELSVRSSIKSVKAHIILLLISLLLFIFWLSNSAVPVALMDVLIQDAGVLIFASFSLTLITLVDQLILNPAVDRLIQMGLGILVAYTFLSHKNVVSPGSKIFVSINLVIIMFFISIMWVVLIEFFILNVRNTNNLIERNSRNG